MALCWHHETCWSLLLNPPRGTVTACECQLVKASIYLRADGLAQNSKVMMSHHDFNPWNDTVSRASRCTLGSGEQCIHVWLHIPGWLCVLLDYIQVTVRSWMLQISLSESCSIICWPMCGTASFSRCHYTWRPHIKMNNNMLTCCTFTWHESLIILTNFCDGPVELIIFHCTPNHLPTQSFRCLSIELFVLSWYCMGEGEKYLWPSLNLLDPSY